MIPAPPHNIKQNLNKAFRLIKPKRARVETFKTNLAQLINSLEESKKEENAEGFLEDLFKGTYFDLDFQEPENSSPVCFANASGLREGFEDPFLSEPQTPSDLDSNTKEVTPFLNRINPNTDLKNAIHLIKYSVMEVLKYRKTKLQADSIELEKQIEELVYQLYELTPD